MEENICLKFNKMWWHPKPPKISIVSIGIVLFILSGTPVRVTGQMTLLGGECGPGTPCGGVGYVVGNLVKELQTQTAEYRELRRELRSLRREIGRLKREMVAGKVALAELTQNMTRQVTMCNNRSPCLCGGASGCCSGAGPHPECCSRNVKTAPTSSTLTSKTNTAAASATARKENPQMIDCSSWWNLGHRSNTTYMIKPVNASRPFAVWCEMSLTGAWTVIQRRQDGSVDFYRDWADYKNGFGEIGGEHWLGNERIYQITNQAKYKLMIYMKDWNGPGNEYTAQSSQFRIGNEEDKYRLYVPGSYSAYSGFGASGLRVHRGPFCTRDRNNLYGRENCAVTFHCGWWFSSCVSNVNINGRYYANGYANVGKRQRARDDLYWTNIEQSLREVEMKIRRV